MVAMYRNPVDSRQRRNDDAGGFVKVRAGCLEVCRFVQMWSLLLAKAAEWPERQVWRGEKCCDPDLDGQPRLLGCYHLLAIKIHNRCCPINCRPSITNDCWWGVTRCCTKSPLEQQEGVFCGSPKLLGEERVRGPRAISQLELRPDRCKGRLTSQFPSFHWLRHHLYDRESHLSL
jgi:hypothetical protein